MQLRNVLLPDIRREMVVLTVLHWKFFIIEQLKNNNKKHLDFEMADDNKNKIL